VFGEENENVGFNLILKNQQLKNFTQQSTATGELVGLVAIRPASSTGGTALQT
jgi:hypothetical protein